MTCKLSLLTDRVNLPHFSFFTVYSLWLSSFMGSVHLQAKLKTAAPLFIFIVCLYFPPAASLSSDVIPSCGFCVCVWDVDYSCENIIIYSPLWNCECNLSTLFWLKRSGRAQYILVYIQIYYTPIVIWYKHFNKIENCLIL